MFHLLKIEDIQHVDVDGSVLWEQKGINNIFHLDGEFYLLNIAFNTGGGITVPSSYYIGMDNRITPAISDTLANLSQEPTQFGYLRQPVSSANGFDVALNTGNYRATSDIVTFSAAGGTWGPVKNLFITTSATNSGYLISTASLDTARSVQDGQTLTLRFSIGLANV